MKNGTIGTTAGGLLLALLTGCGVGANLDLEGADPGDGAAPGLGAGNGAPPAGPVAEADVLVGVFVDSAVSGLSYRTATRSGVTDAEGRFEYLAGESIVFSIGQLAFPAVPAGPVVTPIDLGRGSADAERFAINVARLLQTLDVDVDPENGIVIAPAAASATVDVAFEFDVPETTFERDPAVIELAATAPVAELVSAEQAREHLARTLGGTAPAGVDASAIAGFWRWAAEADDGDLDADDEGPSYLAVSADGTWTSFSPEEASGARCHLAEHGTLLPLGGSDYLIAAAFDGDLSRADLVAAGGELTLSGVDRDDGERYARTASAVTALTPASLTLCPGSSLQPPPPGEGGASDVAGTWVEDDFDATGLGPAYLVLEPRGTGRRFEPMLASGPGYPPEVCHAVHEFEFERGGQGGYEAFPVEEGTFVAGLPESLALDGGRLLVESRTPAWSDTPFALVETLSSRSDVDPETLPLCGASTGDTSSSPDGTDEGDMGPIGPADPLESLVGLWRNQGDDRSGHHLMIDVYGQVRDFAPELGGQDCHVVTESDLVPIGPGDFVQYFPEGDERLVRAERVGDALTLWDVTPEGEVIPVRWLERAEDGDAESLSECGIVDPGTDQFDTVPLAPYVGLWSRTPDESFGEPSVEGGRAPYTSVTEIWSIEPDGILTRSYVQYDEYEIEPGVFEDTICTSEITAQYLSPLSNDPFDLFDVDGEWWQLALLDGTLQVGFGEGYSEGYSLERTETDPSLLPTSCHP